MTRHSALLKDPAAIATLVGIVIGALLTGGTFLASYFAIERPKVQLEEKRVAIEAYKQLVQLQPNIDFDCNPRILNLETIDFICSAKNVGSFGASYVVSLVELRSFSNENDERPGDNWYSIDKSDERSYVPTGSESSVRFVVRIDRTKMPRETDIDRLAADVHLSAESDAEVYELLTQKFPEALSSMKKLKKSTRF